MRVLKGGESVRPHYDCTGTELTFGSGYIKRTSSLNFISLEFCFEVNNTDHSYGVCILMQ